MAAPVTPEGTTLTRKGVLQYSELLARGVPGSAGTAAARREGE
jgi:hypothetical protein